MIVIKALWMITIINQYSEGFYWSMPLSDQAVTHIYLMPCIVIIAMALATVINAYNREESGL